MSWAEEQEWFGLEDIALEYEQQAIDIKELLLQGYWTMANGKQIALKEMSDHHISKGIMAINEGRINREYAIPYLQYELEKRKETKQNKNT